jgi:hypothetical protein
VLERVDTGAYASALDTAALLFAYLTVLRSREVSVITAGYLFVRLWPFPI